MSIVAQKGIKHLSRYFGVLAILVFGGYYYTNHPLLLIFLGPSFFLGTWIRIHGEPFLKWFPSEPFLNDIFILFPITFIYYGLVGFQLKNLANERGKVRLLGIFALLAFLAYIHFMAFKELNLYLAGSTG